MDIFSTGLSEASNSLINNAKLDQQGLFPAADRADGAIVVAFVDFLISFGIMIVLMLWYRFGRTGGSSFYRPLGFWHSLRASVHHFG